MNPGIHGSHIAAHAAAERRRRMMREEEERMTKYSSDELNGDWEFKIVRAETPVFRKTEAFQMLLQEEALAGWQLVEKLDDMRVRFKRPSAARKRDAMLPEGIDPYRTRYGSSPRSLMLVVVMIGVLAAVGAGLFPFFSEGDFKISMIIIAIMVVVMVVGVITVGFSRLRK